MTSCQNKKTVYDSHSYGIQYTVKYGTVKGINTVRIAGENSGAGALIGGVSGGVLGSTVGNGSGQVIGAVVGSLAGAASGHTIEGKNAKDEAYELHISLEDGKEIVVVQPKDYSFAIGERVKILEEATGHTVVSKI